VIKFNLYNNVSIFMYPSLKPTLVKRAHLIFQILLSLPYFPVHLQYLVSEESNPDSLESIPSPSLNDSVPGRNCRRMSHILSVYVSPRAEQNEINYTSFINFLFHDALEPFNRRTTPNSVAIHDDHIIDDIELGELRPLLSHLEASRVWFRPVR